MTEKKETRSDRLLNKIKNNKIVAFIVVIAFLLTVFETITGKFESIWERFTPKEEVIEVKMSYFTFKGHSVSLLVQGKIDNYLKEKIGGNPVIVQNEVYKELDDFKSQFGKLLRENDHLDFDENDELFQNENFEYLKLIPGTYYPFTGFSNYWYKFKEEVKNFPVNLDDGWHLDLVGNPFLEEEQKKAILESLLKGELSPNNMVLTRKINCSEAQAYIKVDNPDLSMFYENLTSNGCPDDFFYVKLHYDFCMGGWIIDLYLPLLEVKCLIIENLTGKPYTIDKLKGTLQKAAGIANEKADMNLVGKLKPIGGDAIVKANELLIIPTNIQFSWDKSSGVDFYKDSFERGIKFGEDTLISKLGNQKKLTITTGNEEEKSSIDEIPVSLVLTSLDEPEMIQKSNIYYYMSQNIKSVEINGRTKEVYAPTDESLFISEGIAYGSCPFVFDNQGNSLGTVLTGRNSIEKEGYYRIGVSENSAQFTIKELEREISYIKWVRLKCKSESGELWHLNPNVNQLVKGDESYLILKQGESVQISFDQSRLGDANELECYGYYEPL